MSPMYKSLSISIALVVAWVALNGSAAEIVQPLPVTPNIQAAPGLPNAKRLLWEIKTAGGPDRIVEIFVAAGKLFLMRQGVLYAYDAHNGELLWKFPEEGRAWRYTEFTSSIAYPFIQGLYGTELITCLPENEGVGCAGIDVATGQVMHRLKLNGEFAQARSAFDPIIAGSRMGFWNTDDKSHKTSVLIVDLDKWQEFARVELPGSDYGDAIYAFGDRLYGVLIHSPSGDKKVFSADLKTAEFFSVPLRHAYPVQVLPDGTRIATEGLIGPKCNYMGSTNVFFAENGIGFSCDDGVGLGAIDIASGKMLWKFDLGHTPEFRLAAKVAASNEITALYDHNFVYVLDSKNGLLKGSIRLFDSPVANGGELMHSLHIKTDGHHVFVVSPHGLRVYSAHGIDPEHADLSDSADPKSQIVAARQALQQGNYEAGLVTLSGISIAIRTRPSDRTTAAGLFSQLSRSNAPILFPRLWTQLMLDDGWIAGELFMPEFKRLAPKDPRAAAALIKLGITEQLANASAKPESRTPTRQNDTSSQAAREQLESQAAGEGKKDTIKIITPSKAVTPPKPPMEDF